MSEKPLMGVEDEAVLLWVIMPKEKYDEVKLPQPCYAKAVAVGKVGDLQHKMHCAHWGITIGKSLHRLGEKLTAHLPKSAILNPMDN